MMSEHMHTRSHALRGNEGVYARSKLLRLFERGRVDLVQGLELGDFLLDEPLAVALALDFGGLLDAAEVLVVGERGFLGEFVALEPGDGGHQLHGEAALLVEEEPEVLAVGPGYLHDGGGPLAGLLLAGR